MDATTQNRLVKLVNDFVQSELTSFEHSTIDSISSCTEDGATRNATYKVVLTLRFSKSLLLKFKDSDDFDLFDGPKGLTLILDKEKVQKVLWHGIDIEGKNPI